VTQFYSAQYEFSEKKRNVQCPFNLYLCAWTLRIYAMTMTTDNRILLKIGDVRTVGRKTNSRFLPYIPLRPSANGYHLLHVIITERAGKPRKTNARATKTAHYSICRHSHHRIHSPSHSARCRRSRVRQISQPVHTGSQGNEVQ
jgi:hypothetical protein